MTEQNPFESKQRIIQEFVPGKQVTMAHLIANPNEDLYKKLGVVSKTRGALGILTITPSEAAIIGADVATKAAEVEIVFVDRFSGSLVVCGDVAAVDAAGEWASFRRRGPHRLISTPCGDERGAAKPMQRKPSRTRSSTSCGTLSLTRSTARTTSSPR